MQKQQSKLRYKFKRTFVVSLTVLPTPFVAPDTVSVRPVTVPPRVLPRPETVMVRKDQIEFECFVWDCKGKEKEGWGRDGP